MTSAASFHSFRSLSWFRLYLFWGLRFLHIGDPPMEDLRFSAANRQLAVVLKSSQLPEKVSDLVNFTQLDVSNSQPNHFVIDRHPSLRLKGGLLLSHRQYRVPMHTVCTAMGSQAAVSWSGLSAS